MMLDETTPELMTSMVRVNYNNGDILPIGKDEADSDKLLPHRRNEQRMPPF
jgi:hypothetical protein